MYCFLFNIDQGKGEDSQLDDSDFGVMGMDAEQLEKFTVQHPSQVSNIYANFTKQIYKRTESNHLFQCIQEENYRLFFANNTWYVVLRLHQILCERLTKLLETASSLAQNEPKETRDPKHSAAIALRLKPKRNVQNMLYICICIYIYVQNINACLNFIPTLYSRS